MNVAEAIKRRRSIRSFRPDHVPEETLERLLELARWAPSGVNAQTWEFVVLIGEALEAVKRANEKQFELGVEPHPYLTLASLSEPYRQRQVALGKGLYMAMGIARDNRAGRDAWSRKGLRFFDAPAAILVCFDQKVTERVAIFEAGLVTQTVALAALHFGLDTCIQRSAVDYPDVIGKVLGMQDSKRICIGIAVGYADCDHAANKFRIGREPLEALVTWHRSLGSQAP